MDITVNEQDLRAVISSQAQVISNLQMNNAALSRTIQDMEMAAAAESAVEAKPAKTK